MGAVNDLPQDGGYTDGPIQREADPSAPQRQDRSLFDVLADIGMVNDLPEDANQGEPIQREADAGAPQPQGQSLFDALADMGLVHNVSETDEFGDPVQRTPDDVRSHVSDQQLLRAIDNIQRQRDGEEPIQPDAPRQEMDLFQALRAMNNAADAREQTKQSSQQQTTSNTQNVQRQPEAAPAPEQAQGGLSLFDVGLPVVQRAIEPTSDMDADTQNNEDDDGVDVETLARDVFRKLRNRLRTDRERRGLR